jgi:hypothetical protein
VVCFARGPRERGWIGWGGGWKIRRDDLPPKKNKAPEPTELEMALEEAGGVRDDNAIVVDTHQPRTEKSEV